MRKTFIALAAAATVFAAPAMAADPADSVTISIQTNDLDLGTVEGQDRLENRIDTAIRRACQSGGRDLASRRAEAACRDALGERFAPVVEVAIVDAQATRLAAIDTEPHA
ncbi:MAG: UrcA family protein [Alteraurantiacibacter sp.]